LKVGGPSAARRHDESNVPRGRTRRMPVNHRSGGRRTATRPAPKRTGARMPRPGNRQRQATGRQGGTGSSSSGGGGRRILYGAAQRCAFCIWRPAGRPASEWTVFVSSWVSRDPVISI
jgi:hypothetical protein